VAQSYRSREEAEAAKADLEAVATRRSVREAAEAYVKSLRARGLAEVSADRAWRHLMRFFALKTSDGGALRGVTPARVRAIYQQQATTSKPDTHQNGLKAARTFFNWCIEQGWRSDNPVAKTKPVGVRNKGKEQLRLTEARTLTAYCLARAVGEVEPFALRRQCRPVVPSTPEGAIGVLACFYLDCRVSEVVNRQARDIDDEGRLFWIPKAKTMAGRRCLPVPDVLAPLLVELARGKRPDERIFTLDRHEMLKECHRLCLEAGVPKVSLHGLRGSGASIAAEHGAAIKAISEAMGHTRESMTRGHYVRQDAAAAGQQKRLLKMMKGGRS
jgi:integrase